MSFRGWVSATRPPSSPAVCLAPSCSAFEPVLGGGCTVLVVNEIIRRDGLLPLAALSLAILAAGAVAVHHPGVRMMRARRC